MVMAHATVVITAPLLTIYVRGGFHATDGLGGGDHQVTCLTCSQSQKRVAGFEQLAGI
jgi:hypothetical protein